MIIEINMPDIGTDTVEVTEVLVRVGDRVQVEQALITVEGDKASIEVPAPFKGIVKEIKINVGDKVNTGSQIMVFEVEGSANTSTSIKENITTVGYTLPSDISKISLTPTLSPEDKDNYIENNTYVHASPLIRRLAREFGVNLAKVKGTGRKGRILREDIQTYIKNMLKQTESTPTTVSSSYSRPWPKIDFSKFGNIEEVELNRIQNISGANLHRNWVMIPHVTQFDETDITEVETFRKQENANAEKKKLDIKITPLVFIMKSVARALEELPYFNSSLSSDSQKLILKKYINIGVAVDTSIGLMVPVFRDVNKKGIIELSRELTTISKKARAGKLVSSDMQGGCFTISSLGNIGGTSFTPIINAPEVAILGVSKSSTKPVWNGKEFTPRTMLPLALSYDHRVINGADGARFISFINKMMSDIRYLVM